MEASGSQVSGRGGWDPGLLGHVCACARVRMCTLGLLVSSDGGGILQEENIPSCKKGAGGGEAILSPSSGPPFRPPLVLMSQGQGRRNTVSRGKALTGLCRKSLAGLGRREQLCSRPCSFIIPLGCASHWALSKGQGCGAWGRGGFQ